MFQANRTFSAVHVNDDNQIIGDLGCIFVMPQDSDDIIRKLKEQIARATPRADGVPSVMPVASSEEIRAAESELGFEVSPMLKRIYREVGNGGCHLGPDMDYLAFPVDMITTMAGTLSERPTKYPMALTGGIRLSSSVTGGAACCHVSIARTMTSRFTVGMAMLSTSRRIRKIHRTNYGRSNLIHLTNG